MRKLSVPPLFVVMIATGFASVLFWALCLQVIWGWFIVPCFAPRHLPLPGGWPTATILTERILNGKLH